MSSNNRDISVSTTRNSVEQLISSESIDGIKYYTYKFHLFIKSNHSNYMVLNYNGIIVNGVILQISVAGTKLSYSK